MTLSASTTSGSKWAPAFVHDDLESFLERVGLLVWPRVREHVEHVGNGHDPRLERNLRTGDPVRVSGAIPALVVSARDGRGHREDPVRTATEDLDADGGMTLHDRDFACVESPGLAQNRVRDADLADVVERSGPADQVDLLCLQPELCGE